MPNIFAALEIGKRALQTQQVSMQTSDHNVANANTPGYSRQTAIITTAPSLPLIGSQQNSARLGTGTQIATISRVRDKFLDVRIREMTEDVGKFSRLGDVFDVLEIIFNELSATTDINHLFSEFWNAWETLAQDPTDRALRIDLRQRAEMLIGDIRNLYARLREVQNEQDSELHIKIAEVNQKAALIAQLNDEIVTVESSGAPANDLRDRRIVLIEELASLSNIEVAELYNGSVNISIEGVPLVQSNRARELHITLGQEHNRVATENGTEVYFTGGEIGGIVTARDVAIPSLLSQLDELIATLVEEVNAIHRQGYSLDGDTTNVNFFTPYTPIYEMELTQADDQFFASLLGGELVAANIGEKLTLIPADPDTQLEFIASDGLYEGTAKVEVLNNGLIKILDDGGTRITESHLKLPGAAIPMGEHQIQLEQRGNQLFARLDQGRAMAISDNPTLVAGSPAEAIQVLFQREPTAPGEIRFTIDRRAQREPALTNLISAGNTGLAPGDLQGFVSSIDVSRAAEVVSLASEVVQDVGTIAAAQTQAPGDNTNALEIVQLQNQPFMAGGTLTLDAFYGSMVTSLGIEAAQTQQNLENVDLVLQQMLNRRESISGVSLDEELTNIIRFQDVYEAAARLITIIDSMIDTVINRMGITR